jgi:hypothetical protein
MTPEETLLAMPEVRVPPRTVGVYVAVLTETAEVKVGCAVDVMKRLRSIQGDLGLSEPPRLLGVLPGHRQVESDVHARLRPDLSRTEGPLSNELYKPTERVLRLVERIRSQGFTENDLLLGMQRGAACKLAFDDGQLLVLELTYLHLIQEGELIPRYMVIRTCRACGRSRSSLEFLGAFDVQCLGRRAKARRDYVVLHDVGDGVCCHCSPKRLILPAVQSFDRGKTSLRIGTLLDRDGKLVRGYDRDHRSWTELIDFGIRRMAKRHREGHRNDHGALRLQPYITRRGRPEGDPPAQAKAAFTKEEQP